MTPTLSILTATRGRATLERMLDSGVGQLRPGDEWLVVADTYEMATADYVALWARLREFGPRVRHEGYDAARHSFGHDQLNHGMARAVGSWLVFQDDDDVFTPGALDAIRRAIAGLHRQRPLLFRFRACFDNGARPVVWQREGVVARGMIGGHCIVVPNVPEKLGRWAPHHAGDFDFVDDTLARWHPIEPLWIDHVITIQRPA